MLNIQPIKMIYASLAQDEKHLHSFNILPLAWKMESFYFGFVQRRRLVELGMSLDVHLTNQRVIIEPRDLGLLDELVSKAFFSLMDYIIGENPFLKIMVSEKEKQFDNAREALEGMTKERAYLSIPYASIERFEPFQNYLYIYLVRVIFKDKPDEDDGFYFVVYDAKSEVVQETFLKVANLLLKTTKTA